MDKVRVQIKLSNPPEATLSVVDSVCIVDTGATGGLAL
jgi:hypothetical protein